MGHVQGIAVLGISAEDPVRVVRIPAAMPAMPLPLPHLQVPVVPLTIVRPGTPVKTASVIRCRNAIQLRVRHWVDSNTANQLVILPAVLSVMLPVLSVRVRPIAAPPVEIRHRLVPRVPTFVAMAYKNVMKNVTTGMCKMMMAVITAVALKEDIAEMV